MKENIRIVLKGLQHQQNLKEIIKVFDGVPVCLLLCAFPNDFKKVHKEVLKDDKITKPNDFPKTLNTKEDKFNFLHSSIRINE